MGQLFIYSEADSEIRSIARKNNLEQGQRRYLTLDLLYF